MSARLKANHVFINCPFDSRYKPIFDAIVFTVLNLGFVARFGPKNQINKRTLILDTEPYRYRQFISDISGQDIRAHGGDPERAIREVRDWLQTVSRGFGLAGGGELIRRYRQFQADLPAICGTSSLETDRLTFVDLSTAIVDWLPTVD